MMRTTLGLFTRNPEHELLTGYSQPGHIFIVIFRGGVNFTLFKQEKMPNNPPADVAQEQGGKGELGIPEQDRRTDDNKNKTSRSRPRIPIQFLKARETDIADHQVRNHQHEWQEGPRPREEGGV